MTSLYFIQSGTDGPVKIGTSGDPVKRLSYLQVGNPEPLRMLGTWPDTDRDEEHAVHEFLRGERIRGEWFAPSSAVIAFAEAWE